MRFMVIEQFRNGDPKSVYRRLAETGRRVPDGVSYLDSWVDLDHGRCFRLMRYPTESCSIGGLRSGTI